MKTTLRVLSVLAIIGYVRAGWNVIPTIKGVDAFMIFLAIFAACMTCLQSLLSGKLRD